LDDEVVDVSDDEKKKLKDEDEVAADKLFQASKPKTQSQSQKSQKSKTTTVKRKKAQNFM
jgi:replication factor C subunit 1